MLPNPHNTHLMVTRPPVQLPEPETIHYQRIIPNLTNKMLDQRIKNATHKLTIDSFAGGGGASEGMEWALGRPVDIAINHNKRAIDMHRVNHPWTRHYNESVWDVHPKKATFGKPVGVMWFSPDCRHFSKAKGGTPVSAKVRGLAWIVIKWCVHVKPDVIHLENVEEFQTWGPLIKCKDGWKPDPKRKGETFKQWKKKLERAGYVIEHKVQACDRWGVPTTRKRFFLTARRDGKPIIWPADTHGKEGEGLKPRLSAADHVIDWSLDCPSIFERKKELALNTQRRIAKGLEKFVFNKAEPFIVKTNHAYDQFRGQSINEPLSTRTRKNGDAVVMPVISRLGQTKWNGDNASYDVEDPITTITRKNEHCLVAPILERSFGTSEGARADEPVQTLTTKNKTGLVTAFLGRHKFMNAGQDLREPLPTITAGAGSKRPAGAAHSLGVTTSHLVKLRGTNLGSEITEPLATLSAGGTHHAECRAFLTKFYGSSSSDRGFSVQNPIDTVTAKGRYGLVEVYGDLYEIVDIGFRMLQPHELYKAHGFPEDYVIDHDINFKPFTKADKTAFVGNSVPPRMAYLLVRANVGDQSEINNPIDYQEVA